MSKKKSKKKKDQDRVDLDVRPYPNPIFQNYDYTSEKANKTSPGGGLYHGRMDKYKSVTDFRNQKEKENKNASVRQAKIAALYKEFFE